MNINNIDPVFYPYLINLATFVFGIWIGSRYHDAMGD